MAHQNEDSVNISGGSINGLSILSTDEFILDSNSREIVIDKQNTGDEVFLYLRNIEQNPVNQAQELESGQIAYKTVS